MALPWILTAPASRGVGFELTRRLLKTTNLPVVATARKDVENTKERLLDGLEVDKDRLEVLKLDVTGKYTLLPPISPLPRNHSN